MLVAGVFFREQSERMYPPIPAPTGGAFTDETEMADADKKTFPYIANKNWWELRRRWLGSPPSGPVTVTYLESALGLNQGVAQYLQGQLQLVGLIDDADKMTDLAHEWRHDDDYAAACAKMVKALYPVELLDAVP